MKIGYIILAHKNPQQLDRLIKRLAEPWTTFYIHIDTNKEIEPFKRTVSNKDKLFFLEGKDRKPGIWGDIGIVKATLNALKKGLQENRPDFFILLTGQDYPLKNNKFIYNYFSHYRDTNFIDQFPMPLKVWENGGLMRINRYKINKSSKRGHFTFLPSVFDREFYSLETAGKLSFLLKSGKVNHLIKILKQRKFPSYLKPFGGSAYFALPLKTAEKIIEHVDTHPEYLTYHQHTLSADEIFFHSIVAYLNATQDLKLAPSLTYVNWQKREGPPPITFRSEDFEELKMASKDFLFARKFDIDLDEEILEKCDKYLLD